MESAGARILVSIVGSALVWLLYALFLSVAYHQFGPQFFDFENARPLYLFAIPTLFCIAWAVGPNLLREFDGTSIAAITLAAVLSVPICVIASLLFLGCGYFGDCL
jgi:hypothetical protein